MDESEAVIGRLYGLTLPYRRTIALGMLCLVLGVAAELYPPLVWQRVVDDGLKAFDWVFVAGQAALLVGALGIGQLLGAVRGVLLERAGQRLTLDLRLRLYAKLQTQSASFFTQQRTGDLLSRITSDVDTIQDVMISGTDSVVANALRVVGVAAIFIALQPLLGVITVLPMLAVGLLLWRYNGRIRPFYRAARKRLGLLSARLADSIGGIRVIQSFAQEKRDYAEVERIGSELYQQQVEAVILRNRVFPIIRFVGSLGNVIMLVGGVALIARGQFTIGGLLAYRGYGRYFYGPIDDLVGINDLVQRAAAAGQRIFAVLDAPVSVADAPDATPLPRVAGDIRFADASFGYDAARPVLHNLTLHIRPGERVAILGPSGAGKSTLLALAARLYDPTGGAVSIDGRDLRAVTLESLRANLAQVQQETFLFNETVLENIRFSRPNATPEQVEVAARAANAHGFIAALSDGYGTLVGERGVRLSGGQKQRISVARALLADTPVLLLDEPTSAVEPESEALIIEGLERLMEGRTALIVSHRLSLARSADRLVVIEDGRLVEQGAPDALAADAGSRFAAMLRAEQGIMAGRDRSDAGRDIAESDVPQEMQGGAALTRA